MDAVSINDELLDTVRIARQTDDSGNAVEIKEQADQQTAESKSPAIDELSLDNADDDENRNKRWDQLPPPQKKYLNIFLKYFFRFLHFGFGGDKSGGSGGGSGNFLFDIIRVSILLTSKSRSNSKRK